MFFKFISSDNEYIAINNDQISYIESSTSEEENGPMIYFLIFMKDGNVFQSLKYNFNDAKVTFFKL